MFFVRINSQDIELARLEITVVRNGMLTIGLEFAGNLPQNDQVPASFDLEVPASKKAMSCVLCGREYNVVEGIASDRLNRAFFWSASTLVDWLAKKPKSHLIYQRTPNDVSLSQAMVRWTGEHFQSILSGELADRRLPTGACYLRPSSTQNQEFLTSLVDLTAESTGHCAWNGLGDQLIFSTETGTSLPLNGWSLVAHGPGMEGAPGLDDRREHAAFRSTANDRAVFVRHVPHHAENLLNELLEFQSSVIEGGWPLVSCAVNRDGNLEYVYSAKYTFEKPASDQDQGLSCKAVLEVRHGVERATTEACGAITVPGTFQGWSEGEWGRFRVNTKKVSAVAIFSSWTIDLLTGDELLARVVGAAARREGASFGTTVKYVEGDDFLISVRSGQVPLAFCVQGPGQFDAGVTVRLDVPADQKIWLQSAVYIAGKLEIAGELDVVAANPQDKRLSSASMKPGGTAATSSPTAEAAKLADGQQHPAKEDADAPAFAVCYLTKTDEYIFLSETDYHQLRRDAAPLEQAVTALADANAKNDKSAARVAQAEIEKHLVPKGHTLKKDDLLEVIDFKGAKFTYVRSDKIAKHVRRYRINIDIRDQSKLRDRDGKVDKKKVSKAFKELKIKVVGGTEAWERHALAFATSSNDKPEGQTTFSGSAEAVFGRCYARLFKGELTLKSISDWKLTASTDSTLSVFEGKVDATYWLFSKEGIRFLPQPPGFRHPLVLGWFRPYLRGEINGFVGASFAGSAEISVTPEDKGGTLAGEAFAGAKVSINLAAYLEWRGSPTGDWLLLAKVGYKVGLAAGLGTAVDFRVAYDRKVKKFMVRAKAALVIAVGAGGSVEGEVDAAYVFALARFVVQALRAADFQSTQIVEDYVRQVLGELLGYSAVMDKALEEAYRVIDTVRQWWRSPWTWITPDQFAARLDANPPLLEHMTPEGKGKIVRLLCEAKLSDPSLRERAIGKVLGWTRSDAELQSILAWMSTNDQPITPAEGRRILLAAGGSPVAGQLQRLATAYAPADPSQAIFRNLT